MLHYALIFLYTFISAFNLIDGEFFDKKYDFSNNSIAYIDMIHEHIDIYQY